MQKQNNKKNKNFRNKNIFKKRYVCLVAGGSGGHITPALQLGKDFFKKNKNSSVLFFGNKKKFDQKLINKSWLSKTILLKFISVPGKKFWRYPLFIFQFTFSLIKSFFILQKFRPEKIISTGGHIALPVCLAGSILKIPIELHELNVIPGKAIKFLSPIAKNIFVTFETSKTYFKKNKCTLERYPLRFCQEDKFFIKEKIIENLNQEIYQEINQELCLSPERKTIFLLGGSQGSVFLNNLLKDWIMNYYSKIKNSKIKTNFQIIHQTGIYDKTDWKSFYKKQNIPALSFSYYENIKNCYLVADVIISRGGAGTLFELEFFNKKSIIVPLKNHAGGHQVANAAALSKRHPDLFTLYDQDFIAKNISLFDQELSKFL